MPEAGTSRLTLAARLLHPASFETWPIVRRDMTAVALAYFIAGVWSGAAWSTGVRIESTNEPTGGR